LLGRHSPTARSRASGRLAFFFFQKFFPPFRLSGEELFGLARTSPRHSPFSATFLTGCGPSHTALPFFFFPTLFFAFSARRGLGKTLPFQPPVLSRGEFNGFAVVLVEVTTPPKFIARENFFMQSWPGPSPAVRDESARLFPFLFFDFFFPFQKGDPVPPPPCPIRRVPAPPPRTCWVLAPARRGNRPPYRPTFASCAILRAEIFPPTVAACPAGKVGLGVPSLIGAPSHFHLCLVPFVLFFFFFVAKFPFFPNGCVLCMNPEGLPFFFSVEPPINLVFFCLALGSQDLLKPSEAHHFPLDMVLRRVLIRRLLLAGAFFP